MQVECGMQAISNKCREVMKHHNHPVDHLSDHELSCLLNKGVMVDGNKRFWLDAKHHMCAELFARALDISWGSDSRYWSYKVEKLSTGECIEAAELREVWWLEVKGHMNAKMLTPNTEYEVVFDIQMKPCATGFCHPVKFHLTTPDGCKIESEKCLDQLKGKGWAEVSIGKFRNPIPCVGERKIEFKMHEINAHVKSGLIVRGVIIRPAPKCGC